MKIKIITIGEVKKSFIKEGAGEYMKRLGGFVDVEHVVVKDDAKAYVKIAKLVEKTFVVALDEHGKEFTNAELAQWLEQKELQSVGVVGFVIGAADGHPDSFLSEVDMKLSLSKLTLPHEQALLFLIETLYRSYSIKNNHPYHRN